MTANVGDTVLDSALAHDVEIEAACGGELACSTCHVILEQDLYDSLDEPDEEETDMLDLAWGLTDTRARRAPVRPAPRRKHPLWRRSRLCCQIKVTEELDGATFELPEDPY